MGRKRLVPATDYGRSLYDWYKYQRREDGSTWELENLSEWLGTHGVRISGKQLGEWVKGKYPRLDVAARIADLFGVTLDAMWRHTSNPINLPQDRPKRDGGVPVAAPSPSEAQALKQIGRVRPARPAKSTRRRSS